MLLVLMRQYITLSAFAYVNQDYVRQGVMDGRGKFPI
jgi:hypothetical protein